MKKIALNAIETGAENHGVTNQVETYTFLVEDHIKINKVLDLLKAAAKAYCLTEEGKRTYDALTSETSLPMFRTIFCISTEFIWLHLTLKQSA